MVTLLFLVQFIPGMFVPFQTETIDLSSVAYRTSVILVEDPGWWDDGADKGEDWENHIVNVSRVGLAIDKEHPNMLTMSKINAFNNSTLDLADKLGLFRTISGNRINYSYNITLQGSDGTVMAARGETPPEYGDVASMKRLVKAHTGYSAYFDGEELTQDDPLDNTKVWINVTDMPEKDLIFEITNFNVTGGNPKYQQAKFINGGSVGNIYLCHLSIGKFNGD
ncbi:MAG: hypothetical protein QMD22_11165, partial [archaeon]|nr:hypothetical protein [archaeon]